MSDETHIIWIMNHYASDMFRDKAGRHYWFAKKLAERGYRPTIFCASTHLNGSENVDTEGKRSTVKYADDIPFVFVKTPQYIGNGIKRIKNMFAFYFGLFTATRTYVKKAEKPDVILASSVHPLTLVAGIKIAKKYNVPCICEIRDLWPESIVAYGVHSRRNPIIWLLYKLEKWIYTNADQLIFTMEGGRDYIVERGWDKARGGSVDLDKVYHISNGVNLYEFNNNKAHYIMDDPDLNDPYLFKVIYTGSIRFVNRVQDLIEVAKILRDDHRIMFLVWGDGDQVESLSNMIIENGLTNFKIKGRVSKEFIPSILEKGSLNVFILPQLPLYKYGISPNKLFDYFASGKPVLSSSKPGYSIIDRYHCGVCLDVCTSESMAKEILRFAHMPQSEYSEYQRNALLAAQDYDFARLTEKLLYVIRRKKI